MVKIKAKKDLYNGGKCFSKGQVYELIHSSYEHPVTSQAGLMEKKAINDLGEMHIIGSWWRNFTILGS